ncbi:hypothetical protein KR032_007148, partial [Drosophila birchii]
ATPDKDSDFALWRIAGRSKRQASPKYPVKKADGTWAKSPLERAEAFAESLEERFTPFETASRERVEKVHAALEEPHQMTPPIPPIRLPEVQAKIRKLKHRKSPGADGISSRVAKLLPEKALLFLVLMFNAALRLGHFPKSWKHANVVMIHKKGQGLEGFPQGSVLGPTLYNLFAHDAPLHLSSRSVCVATYADDTAILARSSCVYSATDKLQILLKRFENWACRWNVAINTDKCAVVTFALRRD